MITPFLHASASILCTFYNRKNEKRVGVGAFYSLLLLSSIFLSWVVLFAVDGKVNWGVLSYAVLFAIGFTTASVMMIEALKTGSVVLTALILQLSLIGVTIWGIFFWNTKFTWKLGIGLVFVVLCLWLCLYTGKKEERKISLKWIFFVVMMFLGNAACTIVQKTQQTDFNGEYGNFMMLATGMCALSALVIYLRSDKTHSSVLCKDSWYFPVSAGVLNAVANLLVIAMANSTLSPGLIYPVLSIGGLMVTTVFSVFIFKEKMAWWQWIGVALGFVAIAVLS